MKASKKIVIPPIGLRIIKSAVAILLCFLISFLRKEAGIVFYSQLAALWCIQTYQADTRKNALQRFIGTVIGAVYGLVFLLVKRYAGLEGGNERIFDAITISAMIVVVLYTTVLVKKKYASYFSCVVFLSIVVNHVKDANPYLFVWNRFMDTVIGIVIGIGINTLRLPVERHKEILFLSGLDDTLLDKNDNLSDYGRAELNRMLDDGANFTLSTRRTPASLMKPVQGIRLKLPVIAMDGAVLYDIQENNYLKVYMISGSMSERVLLAVREMGYESFINCIIDDVLVIYYSDNMNDMQKEMVKQLRKSPYRNYVRMGGTELRNVVYFMMVYPAEIIEEIYEKLDKLGFTKDLKIIKYGSNHHPGYSYLKIYNKNASRENMRMYLKDMVGAASTVTFGTIPGKCDVLISPGDSNRVVRELKKRYETSRFRLHR